MQVSYHFISSNEFFTFFREARSQIFGEDFDFEIDKVLSKNEKESRSANWRKVREVDRYHLVAKLEEEIIGWSFGMQTNRDDFYMVNSAVFQLLGEKEFMRK